MKLDQKDFINFKREINYLCCFWIMMIFIFLEIKLNINFVEIVCVIKVNELFLMYINFSYIKE